MLKLLLEITRYVPHPYTPVPRALAAGIPAPVQSKMCLLFFEAGRTGKITDFGPLPNPTRAPGVLGKAPAGAPLD